MLYELAHVVKDRFGFLWNAIEWGNAQAFAILHAKGLRQVPSILEQCSGEFTLREAKVGDAAALAGFFADQPEEAFKFFKPHGFDEKSLAKILANKAFLTYVVMDGERIVGYFFLRSFVNGKSFKGYIVDYRARGRGISKLQGIAMNKIAEALSVRLFGSISPENPASLAAAKAVNELKILKTLDNGDYYIEFLPKTAGEA